ncbi:YicC family protein [bacterium]|nr:YicC family protein [bacterium]
MINSMTGYGKGGANIGSTVITVEIKSVNNRYCEVFTRMPFRFTIQEEQVREKVKGVLKRGKIDVLVEITGDKKSGERIAIDDEKLLDYLSVLNNVKKKYNIEGDITVQDILNLDDVFIKEEEKNVIEIYWDGILKAVLKALINVEKSRRAEGKNIEKDLRKRIGIIRKNLSAIEAAAKKRSKAVADKLHKKVEILVKRIDRVNKERLELEILLLSEKYDITEERVRLKHHNSFFLETLKDGGEAGKRLEFILQEMTREVNTIGAKGSSFDISKYVVIIKEEVEKLREQVRNIV